MEVNRALLKAYGMLEDGQELYRNFYGTDVKYIAKNVGIRKVFDAVDKRFRLEIVIDDQTNKYDIPAVWEDIKRERESLAQAQGHELNDYFQVALTYLSEKDYSRIVEDENAPSELPEFLRYKREEAKPEYRELLMDANFDILVFTIRASKSSENPDKAKFALSFLSSMMHLFRGQMTKQKMDSDIALWLDEAFRCLKEGELPYDIRDGPISFETFSNKLEYLFNLYGHEPRSPQSKTNLLKVYLTFYIWGDWNEASELLKRPSSDQFQLKINRPVYPIYKQRLDARLAEILIYASATGSE
jgi:hypothetical protein